mgnify:CR=1 FL=1
MLSYQHIFHAGNLADVQKHALLAWALDYLTQKDKPLSYIETHAGRGVYDLTSAAAAKTGEAAAGIQALEAAFPADHPYARRLAETRAIYGEAAYPGSPLIAALSLLPIVPRDHWKPADPAVPIGRILLLLAATIGGVGTTSTACGSDPRP